ncbi:MAG: glycoside hydrolase family 9 protein [Defluviitaleaceae bacterium]|nr:glycoside hydrolase family 9 protein [Defluviitaleaceae bacterium]
MTPNIHLNQLGYRPADIKKAVLPGNATFFRVVRVDGSFAFEGTPGDAIYDAPSDETVRVADFSAMQEKGDFVLVAEIAEGSEESYPFMVCNEPYNGLRKALLDFFEYQKCGVEVGGGAWAHPPCHTTPATIYGTNETKDVTGGWHDAGDYGRYIVPAAKAVADLLIGHENTPNPDANLLETVRFELNWMRKMQCDKTGGVYHKVSCHHFNALDEMPHDEHNALVLSPISATATADFAAIMAMAGRFFPDDATDMLTAARNAWAWLQANPDYPTFKNPDDIFTGGYGARTDADERYWAANALYAATGEAEFHDYVKGSEILVGLGWGQVGTYGIYEYLFHAHNQDETLAAAMRDTLLSQSARILDLQAADPYGNSLGDNYMWGSNMTVANNALMLLITRKLTHTAGFTQKQLTQAAWEHLHYLLGRNPLSQSYITGFGENAARHPHHRPSVAVGQCLPGMVVGGPNRNTQQDDAMKTHRNGAPPSKAYIDHQDSYSANEVTIYWNSPVYAVSAMLGL